MAAHSSLTENGANPKLYVTTLKTKSTATGPQTARFVAVTMTITMTMLTPRAHSRGQGSH